MSDTPHNHEGCDCAQAAAPSFAKTDRDYANAAHAEAKAEPKQFFIVSIAAMVMLHDTDGEEVPASCRGEFVSSLDTKDGDVHGNMERLAKSLADQLLAAPGLTSRPMTRDEITAWRAEDKQRHDFLESIADRIQNSNDDEGEDE